MVLLIERTIQWPWVKLSLSKSFHKSRLAPRAHLRPDGIVMMIMRVIFSGVWWQRWQGTRKMMMMGMIVIKKKISTCWCEKLSIKPSEISSLLFFVAILIQSSAFASLTFKYHISPTSYEIWHSDSNICIKRFKLWIKEENFKLTQKRHHLVVFVPISWWCIVQNKNSDVVMCQSISHSHQHKTLHEHYLSLIHQFSKYPVIMRVV